MDMCYDGALVLPSSYAGINTAKKWSKWKWQTRAIVIGTASRMGLAGTIAGTVFMLGLENQLYDMM